MHIAQGTRAALHKISTATYEITRLGPGEISRRRIAVCARCIRHIGAADRIGASKAHRRGARKASSVAKKEAFAAAELAAHSPLERSLRLNARSAHGIKSLRADRRAPSRITAEIRRTALALSPVEPILALHARMVASAGPYKPASDRFRTPHTCCVGRSVARSKVCARRAVESRAGRAVASQRPIISVDADVVASSNPSELACGLAARQALGVIVRRALGLEIARKADEIRAQSALLIASKKITVRAHIRAAVGPIDRAVDRRNRASNTPRIVCTPTFGRIPARRAAHHRARRALCFVEPVAGAALKRTSRRPVVRPNRRSIGTRQAYSVADGSRSAATRIEARDAG